MIIAANFAVYIVYIIASYFIGKALNSLLFKGNVFGSIQNVFLNILFGDILIIALYSLVKCKFQTINILFVALVLTVLIVRRFYTGPVLVQEESSNKRYNWLVWTLIILLPFAIRAIVFYNYEYHLPNIPHYDHQHYINIAETINKTGTENFFTAKTILFDQYRSVTPYRYHDIWLTSLFIELKFLSTISIYSLIVSSFTILISLLGLLSLFEMYRKVSSLVVGLSALFLFTGFAYFYVGNIFIDTQNPVEYQKLGITYALLAAAILFYKKDMLLNMSLAVGILLVFSSASLPMILGVFMLLFFAFIRRTLTFGQAFALAIPYVVVLAGFVLFYKVFGFKDLGVSFTLPNVKTFLFAIKGLTIKTFARFWFIILWLFIALAFNKAFLSNAKKEIAIIMIAIFFIVFCIGFQAIMLNLGDPNQFATNNTIPILHIILYMLIVIAIVHWEPRTILYKTVAAMMILYVIASFYFTYEYKKGFYKQDRITKYDKTYLDEVATTMQGLHNKIGVYWVDSSYYVNSNKMKEFFIRPGEYLKILGNGFDMVCLSADKMPGDRDRIAEYIKAHSALLIFQQQHKELSMIDLKLKFITDYKIEYLIMEKNAILPKAVDSLVSRKIIDNKSGDIFCVLSK